MEEEPDIATNINDERRESVFSDTSAALFEDFLENQGLNRRKVAVWRWDEKERVGGGVGNSMNSRPDE